MRTTLALLALLLTASVPPGAGQAEGNAADATRVFDDPAGDVAVATPASALPAPPGSDYLDLVALDVEEQAEAFALRLTLGGAPQAREVPLAGAMTHAIGFAYGGVGYAVRIEHGIAIAGAADDGLLLSDPAGGEAYEPVQPLEVQRDGATTTVLVPRLALVDAAGAPAFAGQSLTGFWAASSGATDAALTRTGPRLPSAGDRAPDDGVAPAAVPVRFGVRQDGDLRLWSPQPFRASNGEAAAFRFPVTLSNAGAEPVEATLAATGLPAGWAVRVPAPVTVPAGGRVELEVVADVPFAHRHGDFATFTVEARSGDSAGRALLGLLYVSPPQPAGHHDTLFLHSRRGRTPAEAFDTAAGSLSGAVEAYWNTLEEDAGDAGVEVPPDFNGLTEGTGEAHYAWSIPLSPALAIGLDADLAGTGAIAVPIATSLPADGAVLSASVHVLPPDNGTDEAPATPPDLSEARVLARSAPTEPVDLPAHAVTLLEATLLPDAAADYVPHEPGQQLWLRIELRLPRGDVETGPATPTLAPGGWARLPLLEYSDRGAAGAAPAGDGSAADGPSQATAKGTPAPSVALLGLALAALAVVRRRA